MWNRERRPRAERQPDPLLQGGFRHQDSRGRGGIIGQGNTQWMTAGGGVLHIEAPTDELLRAGGVVSTSVLFSGGWRSRTLPRGRGAV